MKKICVGDRVRLRLTSATMGLASRSGTVVLIDRDFGDGPAVSYVVSLDDDAADPAPLSHAVFGRDDLEPDAAPEQTTAA